LGLFYIVRPRLSPPDGPGATFRFQRVAAGCGTDEAEVTFWGR